MAVAMSRWILALTFLFLALAPLPSPSGQEILRGGLQDEDGIDLETILNELAEAVVPGVSQPLRLAISVSKMMHSSCCISDVAWKLGIRILARSWEMFETV